MTRRDAFFAAASLALAAVLPGAAGATDLKPVAKYVRARDEWVACRLYDIRKGDVFRLADDTYSAASDPVRGAGGRWEIDAGWRLDPATNEWVSPHT